MIEATGDFGRTINDLAKDQGWPVVAFVLDGKTYTANSVWAATDWLKAKKVHEEGRHQWVSIGDVLA
ncbi:MAG: hypothetical protein RIB97_13240 [Nitratireductor sp.]